MSIICQPAAPDNLKREKLAPASLLSLFIIVPFAVPFLLPLKFNVLEDGFSLNTVGMVIRHLRVRLLDLTWLAPLPTLHRWDGLFSRCWWEWKRRISSCFHNMHHNWNEIRCSNKYNAIIRVMKGIFDLFFIFYLRKEICPFTPFCRLHFLSQHLFLNSTHCYRFPFQNDSGLELKIPLIILRLFRKISYHCVVNILLNFSFALNQFIWPPDMKNRLYRVVVCKFSSAVSQ